MRGRERDLGGRGKDGVVLLNLFIKGYLASFLKMSCKLLMVCDWPLPIISFPVMVLPVHFRHRTGLS